MSSRRTLKAAEAIREVVSMAILRDLKDPRVRNVTVTAVEVSPDMRQAQVHVSVMGNDTQQNLTLRGLRSAAGFLQAKVAERIETRYTPRLTFELDQGIKRSVEIARRLREVLPPAEEAGAQPSGAEDAVGAEEAPPRDESAMDAQDTSQDLGDGQKESGGSEVRGQETDVECPASNFQHQTSNVQHRTSSALDVGRSMLDVRCSRPSSR